MPSASPGHPNRGLDLSNRNGVVIRAFRARTDATVDARAHAFVAASEQETVFGLFPSPRAAIDKLLKRASRHYRGADALLRAIIKRYQESAEELWPAMLVAAFHHTICKFALREARKDQNRVPFDDVHDIAIASLLEGARSFAKPDEIVAIPCLLCREMKRRTKAALKKERLSHARAEQTEAFEDETFEPLEDRDPLERALEIHQLSAELRARVLAYVESWDGKPPSERTLVTILRSDLGPADQERLYQRVKRRRARLVDDGADPETLPPWWREITNPNEDGRRRR